MRYRAIALLAAALSATAVPAAEPDALAISANIQARHFPFNTILDPVYDAPSSDRIVAYTHCGDSAIWTGHYLAAEAFRYKVTGSPDALANAKRALAGLQALTDVTGTDLLARCAFPSTSSYAGSMQGEEAHNGLYTSANGTIWVGNTSRDQYSGVMFGLAVAYDMIDDAATKAAIAQLATREIDFLRNHAWTVVMPDGSISTTFIGRADQILAFLQIGKHVNPQHFSTAYDTNVLALSLQVTIPISLEVANDDSYFKFNLDAINFYNLLRLESGAVRSIYQDAYNIFRGHTATHQIAIFDVIDRALNSNSTSTPAGIITLLNQWLQRPRRDNSVDLHGSVRVCFDHACDPVPVPLRPPTDYLWQRSPFLLSGGGTGTVETAGIDYILPYWMARFYGINPSFTVQSAAAPSAAVSPDSLASLFGPNLASQTAKAGSLPLPQSLGGISVTLVDSTQTSRQASLLYVSPGQVNLLIPGGTANGIATLNINGGAAPLSAQVNIQGVSPTLFSMSGTGSGVAAATALEVQASDPTLQSPVPVFQCDSSGHCSSVPIPLGVDTPAYLTLYGTGIRNRSALSAVTVNIGGISVPALYAGVQLQYPGLDQVNVPLPLDLRGAGEVNVTLKVDGQISNTVTINLK